MAAIGLVGVPEWPTIRLDILDRAHVELAPSFVRCSVMSASHSWFGACAVKSRPTRSSWTGGPGFLPFLPHALHKPMAEQIRHPVRSAFSSPAWRASSTRNQQPNAGSSR